MTAPVDHAAVQRQIDEINERAIGLTLLEQRQVRDAARRARSRSGAYLYREAVQVADIHKRRVPYRPPRPPDPVDTE